MYKITISNEETGEILLNEEAIAIIGSVNNGESTSAVCVYDCNSMNLAITMIVNEKAIDEVKKYDEIEELYEEYKKREEYDSGDYN